jgi:hypothetical protein
MGPRKGTRDCYLDTVAVFQTRSQSAGSVLGLQHRTYSESGFLNVFEHQWDGFPELTRAYGQVDAYLRLLR